MRLPCPQVQQGLTLATVRWAFTTTYQASWFPLTWLSFMLDWQLWGGNAGALHLVNVAFHIANTLLLFGVLNRMTAAPWRSALVAALFALHPLHVESVAWVTERKDVLSAFFWMLTLGAYVRYVEQPGRGRYWLTLGLFAMGLLAKSMVVTLPFVLLLLDYWPLGRTGWAAPATGDRAKTPLGGLVREKAPFFILAVLASGMTYWAQHSAGTVHPLPISVRVSNVVVSYTWYLAKMFWPGGLAVFYPLEVWPLVAALGPLTLLVAVSYWVVERVERDPFLLMGWSWYLGTLVPVIQWVQSGHHARADRYTYLPSIGLYIIVAWGLARLSARRATKGLAVAGAVAAVSACAVLSWFQVGHWKNSETLFRHAVNVMPDNFVARINLGSALVSQGRFAEAEVEFAAALRIQPDVPGAHYNLGLAMARQGRPAEAVAEFQSALLIDPDYAEARCELAAALAALGRIDEAVAQYREALRRKPDWPAARDGLTRLNQLSRSRPEQPRQPAQDRRPQP